MGALFLSSAGLEFGVLIGRAQLPVQDWISRYFSEPPCKLSRKFQEGCHDSSNHRKQQIWWKLWKGEGMIIDHESPTEGPMWSMIGSSTSDVSLLVCSARAVLGTDLAKSPASCAHTVSNATFRVASFPGVMWDHIRPVTVAVEQSKAGSEQRGSKGAEYTGGIP